MLHTPNKNRHLDTGPLARNRPASRSRRHRGHPRIEAVVGDRLPDVLDAASERRPPLSQSRPQKVRMQVVRPSRRTTAALTTPLTEMSNLARIVEAASAYSGTNPGRRRPFVSRLRHEHPALIIGDPQVAAHPLDLCFTNFDAGLTRKQRLVGAKPNASNLATVRSSRGRYGNQKQQDSKDSQARPKLLHVDSLSHVCTAWIERYSRHVRGLATKVHSSFNSRLAPVPKGLHRQLRSLLRACVPRQNVVASRSVPGGVDHQHGPAVHTGTRLRRVHRSPLRRLSEALDAHLLDGADRWGDCPAGTSLRLPKRPLHDGHEPLRTGRSRRCRPG